MNPRRPVRIKRRLAVCALALVVLVPVAEWGLRATNLERLSHTNPALYEPHPTLGYRMRPDVRVHSHGAWFETNAAGLRGPHWEGVHAAGRECVFFLGHSIVGGFGVTAGQTIPGVFTAENDRDLVGINLGHCGYRYGQELPLALELVPEARPVAAVVMFTGNEFEPPYDPFAPSNVDGDGGSVPLPGKTWLRRNSALYGFLRKRWNRLMVVLGRRERVRHLEYTRLRGQDEESRAHYARYEAWLARLKAAIDGPLVLTAFPLGLPAEAHERLRAMAGRVGARWVGFEDLWEDVVDYRRRGALPWSEHPDAEAHRTMALRLTAALEEELGESSSRQERAGETRGRR